MALLSPWLARLRLTGLAVAGVWAGAGLGQGWAGLCPWGAGAGLG